MTVGSADSARLGMCFLENNVRYRVAALLGISAFVFPEQAPWSLFATLLTTIALVSCTDTRARILALLVSASLFVGVAGGVLSASFVTATLAAIAIASHNRLLALVTLALQTSYAASIEAILADYLFAWNLEAAAPALLSGTLLLSIQSRKNWWHAIIAISPSLIVWVGQQATIPPYGLLAFAGMPPMVLALLTPGDKRPALNAFPRWIVVGVVALGSIGWAMTPPKIPSAGYVLLPGKLDSPEARFFRNYQEVLRFSGLSLKVVEIAEEIPNGSLVLLPWLTAPDDPEHTSSFEKIRELAIERGWLVLMLGEHTNMGGVATKVKTVAGQAFLRNDLSVPPGNTDDSGHMRIADIRAWYPEAMLNRGASVDVHSPLTRVLLSGDGWWAEPDIGEWLWVGDYQWQSRDRHGRLIMATATDEGSARWVVLGDTGPFINQQLVSDPRPAARILDLASLWPLFLRDVGLVTVAAAIVFGLPATVLVGTVGLMAVASLFSGTSSDGAWRSMWRQESAFDERNFNQSLVESPLLLTTDWRLVRPKGPLTKNLSLPEKKTVLFGLVDGELNLGKTKLFNCKRIGSLVTDDILLMDAQACAVEGHAQVLVGDKNEAAIVRVGSLILILDQNFLGQNSPKINRNWLENRILVEH